MKVKFDKFKQTHNKISELKTVFKESIKECCTVIISQSIHQNTGQKAANTKA